jgi:hypothetical protein
LEKDKEIKKEGVCSSEVDKTSAIVSPAVQSTEEKAEIVMHNDIVLEKELTNQELRETVKIMQFKIKEQQLVTIKHTHIQALTNKLPNTNIQHSILIFIHIFTNTLYFIQIYNALLLYPKLNTLSFILTNFFQFNL